MIGKKSCLAQGSRLKAEGKIVQGSRFKVQGESAFSRLTHVALILAVVAAPQTTVAAETDTKERTVSKVITGKLVYVSKRAISIETENTETSSNEMLLAIDQKTNFDRLTSLSELKPGDMVKVYYEQKHKDRDDGTRRLLKTVVTSLSHIKRAPPGGTLRSTEN